MFLDRRERSEYGLWPMTNEEIEQHHAGPGKRHATMNPKIKCFFGRHAWVRLNTEANGIGFLDECRVCGRGRFLVWLDYASTAGTVTKDQLQAWKKEAFPPLP